MPETWILGYECTRCKHQWAKKKDKATGEYKSKPVICPSCRSPYWDREKQHTAAVDAIAPSPEIIQPIVDESSNNETPIETIITSETNQG